MPQNFNSSDSPQEPGNAIPSLLSRAALRLHISQTAVVIIIDTFVVIIFLALIFCLHRVARHYLASHGSNKTRKGHTREPLDIESKAGDNSHVRVLSSMRTRSRLFDYLRNLAKPGREAPAALIPFPDIRYPLHYSNSIGSNASAECTLSSFLDSFPLPPAKALDRASCTTGMATISHDSGYTASSLSCCDRPSFGIPMDDDWDGSKIFGAAFKAISVEEAFRLRTESAEATKKTLLYLPPKAYFGDLARKASNSSLRSAPFAGDDFEYMSRLSETEDSLQNVRSGTGSSKKISSSPTIPLCRGSVAMQSTDRKIQKPLSCLCFGSIHCMSCQVKPTGDNASPLLSTDFAPSTSGPTLTKVNTTARALRKEISLPILRSATSMSLEYITSRMASASLCSDLSKVDVDMAYQKRIHVVTRSLSAEILAFTNKTALENGQVEQECTLTATGRI